MNLRHVNGLSGKTVPGGVTWRLKNRDAEAPEGWRDSLLEFHKYGGPGTSYEGTGKLPPRIKDLICHYFYLLGVNPNEHAEKIPDDYEPRDLEKLPFIPPPADFVAPDWAGPEDDYEEEDNPGDDISEGSGPPSPSAPPPPRPFPSPPPRPSKRRQPESSEESEDSQTEPEPEKEPERIVLRIKKSVYQKPPKGISKPPKKKARQAMSNIVCFECKEGLSSLDKKSKNLFVDCGQHVVHKYCQETCLQDNH